MPTQTDVKGDTLMTTVNGEISNLPGCTRGHKVGLVPGAYSSPQDADKAVDADINSDAGGTFCVVSANLTTGNYWVAVDDLWLSTATVFIQAGAVNNDKDVTLGTPPSLLASSPYPVGDDDVVVAGYTTNPTGSGHAVKLMAATATDPTAAGIRNSTTNPSSYYRFLRVTPGTYKIAIDNQWCSPATITIDGTCDVERHDVELP